MQIHLGPLGRRLLPVLVVAANLGAAIPGGPALPVLAGPPTADCYGSAGNYFGWKNVDSADQSIAGVEGSFTPALGSALLRCTHFGGFFDHSGGSIWSSLSGTGNNGQIVQIGLIRCQGFVAIGTPCDGQIHVVWAWGTCTGFIGCGGSNGIGPTPEDLGLWDGRVHAYQVVRDWLAGVPVTLVKLDGAAPSGTYALADTAIPWINNPVVRGSYFCEVWNQGDECGGSVSSPYYVASLVFKYNPGDVWNRHPISVVPCNISQYPEYCQVDNNDMLHVWSSH